MGNQVGPRVVAFEEERIVSRQLAILPDVEIPHDAAPIAGARRRVVVDPDAMPQLVGHCQGDLFAEALLIFFLVVEEKLP